MAEDRTFGAPVDERYDDVAEQYVEPQKVSLSDVGGSDDLLKMLEADARAELDNEVKLRVANRPGWVLGFSTLIAQAQIKSWEQRSSRGKGKARNTDAVRQSLLMLVEQSAGVYREQPDGSLAQVTDSDGDPLTLTSFDWLDIYPEHKRNSVDVLRHFVGDSGALSLGAALINASGWGDAADEVEDPTQH